MRSSPTAPFVRELALLLTLSTCWGASYTFIRIGVETIPPLTLIAARTLIAGLLLLGIARWRGLHLPRDGRTWTAFLVQAALNSVVPFTLIAWAEQTVDAALATVLNATSPLFAVLLAVLARGPEAATTRQWAGVACGLLGTFCIVGLEAWQGFGHGALAQFAIVGASLCYAAAALFGRRFSSMDPVLPAAGSLLCGAAVLLPLSLLCERPWTIAPSRASLLALLALAVFSTAIALALYFRLLRTLGSVGTTAQAYLRVPIGVGIGVVFLGERLQPSAWIGVGCVVAGVVAMALPRRSWKWPRGNA
ncbi:DMT family transporter [Paracidovorax avenae]|uniref:DMT family transporter n=1 Tax=Paracidovorax avenae TaxID=80867 RepID=UPI000D21F5E7|nr:EamA family transporter [Paracidovorax avenae]AVS96325.1 EamA family transporter [Paracidovorax avenae]AVT03163.1 EamA family transporter [Paracidovorax avenae]AVT10106.1 EamA family transporter [Paracidovorax avenae]